MDICISKVLVWIWILTIIPQHPLNLLVQLTILTHQSHLHWTNIHLHWTLLHLLRFKWVKKMKMMDFGPTMLLSMKHPTWNCIPRKRKETMLHSCKYQHPIIPLVRIHWILPRIRTIDHVGIHWIMPRIRTIDHRHFNQEQLAEAHLNTQPVVLKLHFLLLLLRYLLNYHKIRDR